MNQAIKRELSGVHSWEELLSKYEHYSFEMQKPASLGALWSKIHLKNAEEILGDMKNVRGFGILDIGYSILIKFFKPFSHSLTVHVELNRADNHLVFRESSSTVSGFMRLTLHT